MEPEVLHKSGHRYDSRHGKSPLSSLACLSVSRTAVCWNRNPIALSVCRNCKCLPRQNANGEEHWERTVGIRRALRTNLSLKIMTSWTQKSLLCGRNMCYPMCLCKHMFWTSNAVYFIKSLRSRVWNHYTGALQCLSLNKSVPTSVDFCSLLSPLSCFPFLCQLSMTVRLVWRYHFVIQALIQKSYN